MQQQKLWVRCRPSGCLYSLHRGMHAFEANSFGTMIAISVVLIVNAGQKYRLSG